MGTVLDDVTSETVDAAHIRRRVDDWEERLNGLYALIGDWLPDGWEARGGAPVVMHERLMRKFDVAAKRIRRSNSATGRAVSPRLNRTSCRLSARTAGST